jgi:hypothetical protein
MQPDCALALILVNRYRASSCSKRSVGVASLMFRRTRFLAALDLHLMLS